MQELFSAFGINWQLIIAQAVNFGIVLVALWYFLYKPVLRVLSERQQVVAKSVAHAAQVEELFARADNEAEDRVKAADTEAEKIMTTAREAAAIEKARLLKEAEARAALLGRDAEARAAEAIAKARRESERDIARLAVLAAEKVLRDHHA